ncbi:hypothetical protein [Pseudarthrobacter sp. H2]|uniref:hypothetical protein n=1 Tax=Pseudarthrobacter sp. H2 TaxID=3418415 RepID=UPI003CEC96F5
MAKLVSNYTANGSSTTDEYGTFVVLNRFLQGDVVEGFAVVANGTPNLTVLVQPGSGRITTGTYPSSYGYLISHDTSAGESVTISTPAASPRIDYIVAYIDKAVAGSTSGANVNNTNNVLKFAAVAGTPSGSPVIPTVGQIQTAIGASNPYIILAQVAVGASVSTITNPNITDKRVIATARNFPSQATSSTVVATESTASTTYTDLTTVGPAVTATVGPAGSALVTITCHSYNSAVNDTFMSFAVSGATTQAASDNNAKVTSTTSGQQGSTTTLLTGLNPGTTTFTSKYRVAAGTGGFLRRTISVVPL